MTELKFKATKRELLGRKIKKLRAEGLVPANLYGKKTQSVALTLKLDEFLPLFEKAGETSIVKLTVEGEKEERPVLIKNVQKNPVDGKILHVDFRQIILSEKITAMVPLETEGESPVTTQKIGIFIQTVSEIEVEALPADLPERFVIDISKLENIGDEIKVSDLQVEKGVEILTEQDLVVAKTEPLAAEEVAPVVEETEEGVEGEEPKEGAESEEGEEPKDSAEKEESGEEKKEEASKEE
jgi:large subunit ribosomal protein L25